MRQAKDRGLIRTMILGNTSSFEINILDPSFDSGASDSPGRDVVAQGEQGWDINNSAVDEVEIPEFKHDFNRKYEQLPKITISKPPGDKQRSQPE